MSDKAHHYTKRIQVFEVTVFGLVNQPSSDPFRNKPVQRNLTLQITLPFYSFT
jgi:hypothetical protein